ncbi:AMP-binding protein [Chloroflexota bacterium]
MSTIKSIPMALAERVKSIPNETFFLFNGENHSYKSVDEVSNRVANALAELGVKQSDNVCTILNNNMESVFAFFAVQKLGAVYVPINIQIEDAQVKHIINNCETEYLIIEADILPRVQGMLGELPKLANIIVKGEGEAPKLEGRNTSKFDALFSGKSSPIDTQTIETDLACLLYTSGTTGPPKGVMLSHAYYIAGGELFVKVLGESEKGIFYSSLPFYHIMGQIQGIIAPLMAGAAAAVSEKFSVSRFWDQIRETKATCTCMTGTQVTYLYQSAPKDNDADNTLRIIAAFPVPQDTADGFEKRFDLKLRNVYGLTEALLPIIAMYDGPYKEGALGLPTDYEVRIADDADNEVADLEIGNIILRPISTSRRVFDGYYKMPETTLEMLRHCWFHTGDMGYRDADGFLWFASRKKDIIRFRGENISAPRIESVVCSHDKVLECAAVGVPSEVGEEDIKIVVILEPGQTLAPENLLDHCAEQIAWFMVPRYVEYVESLPKTATDKVEKFKLKKDWKTVATWDREVASYKVKKK